MTADLVPTILAACGVEAAAPVDGIDLAPAIAGKPAAPRIVCGECGPYAFATDGELKYCWYPQGGVEQVFAADDHDDAQEISATHLAEAAPLKAALTTWLAGFGRPKVEDGALVIQEDTVPDERALRRANPAACRGPLRHGMGY